ncbi:MAG: hypothetical protein COA73_11305 [Candidatus Hydrogenedentota bacterium]|nr:MAG: hypothetical protein COA73_11305 [Candidatus Hydrogenedentota bacterium]
MSNREKSESQSLTLQETVELFGAEEPVDIGGVSLDPLGMQFIASRVARHLTKGRGRPTDKSWTIVRKIPMKEETWIALESIATELKEHDIRIATGQMGALALEIGVENFRVGTNAVDGRAGIPQAAVFASYPVEIQVESEKLASAALEESIW